MTVGFFSKLSGEQVFLVGVVGPHNKTLVKKSKKNAFFKKIVGVK